MESDSTQFERIARWLDCEPVDLTGQERALADELRRDEELLKPAMDLGAPRAAMDRARRRMMGELARPRHRTLWVRYAGAGTAAAAVIVLGAVALWQAPQHPGRPGVVVLPEAPIEVVIEKMTEPGRNVDLDLLAQQVAEMAADLAMSRMPPSSLDLQTDVIQHEIEEFWLEEPVSWSPEG